MLCNIHGYNFVIKETKSGNYNGCFLQPDYDNFISYPTILIKSSLSKEEKIATVIHEFVHLSQYIALLKDEERDEKRDLDTYEWPAYYISEFFPFALYYKIKRIINAIGHIPD